MTWEQRLREMILAGGAVATTACGGTTSNASTFDAGEATDATTGDAMSDGGGTDTFVPNFCCNADPDPCCAYENCEASLTAACSKELACQRDAVRKAVCRGWLVA